MFDDEDEFDDGYLNEDIDRFEAFLKKGDQIGFLDSDRWESLIDHFMINGHYKKALSCIDEALSQFSYNTTFKLRRAQVLSAIGNLKEAINILSELERSDAATFELLLTKAAVFSQLKDSDNAIKYFRAALSLADPEDRDDVYLDLAMEYQNSGKFKKALEVLKEAIRINPSNEGAVYEMAHCYEQMDDYDSSVKCYSDFIDENPYSFTAWYNLGNAYSRLDDFDKAIWAYDYSLLINDEFGPVYFNLGNAYLNQDKYTKAIENFNKCITLDGEDPIALCYLGECHEQLGELELARHYYQKSLELAPLLPDAWLGLGIVKDLEGDTVEAIRLIHKATDLDPENAGILHVLAGAYEKMGERVKAKEYYEMSIALDPDDEECMINYINFLKEDSLLDALNYIKTFEDLQMDNDILPVMKVNILWYMGEKTEALELFKTCLENDREKALELFDIDPSLQNVPELVHLSDQ